MKNTLVLNNLKRSVGSVFILFVVCFFFTNSVFAVQCVNPNGTGGCFNSIQDAVNAANPGEKVRIRPGKYLVAQVLIPPGKDGLVIEGTGKSRNDVIVTNLPGNSNPVIDSQSGDVTIENLTVLHGNGIRMGGGPNTGARIVNVKVINASSDCINILGTPGQPRNAVINKCYLSGNQGVNGTGDGLKIRNTSIRCINTGILVNGNGALVENCVLTDGQNHRININGNDTTVRNTKVTSFMAPEGIHLNGNNALVEENVLKGCSLSVNGENPVVKNNAVSDATNAPFGCFVYCTGDCTQARVVNNTVKRTHEGLHVNSDAPGMIVKKNKALFSHLYGFSINGSDMTVTQNIARSSMNNGFTINGAENTLSGNLSEKNRQNGFYVSSNLNVLTNNTSIKNQLDGFYVSGSENDLLDNKANDNLDDGIEVMGPINTLDGNTTRRNIEFGIIVGATNSTVVNNTAFGNRFDICVLGTGHTVDNNTYGNFGCP